MQPRIFGPYEAIRRDYPIAEFLSDIAGSGVTQSVYVQANWAKDRFEDEVAYVQQAADETGFPQAIVGYADFLADDVRPQLDRLTKYSGMRGLRMQLQWHENPQYRFAAGPDLARHPKLQKNVTRLADYNWTFDLQVFEGQMKGAAELADSAPKVASSSSMPACWKTCRTPDGRDGAMECSSLPPVQTYFEAGPRWARSSTKRSRSSKPSGFSARNAVCLVRIFRSRNCGRSTPISSQLTEPRSSRLVKLWPVPPCTIRQREFTGSPDVSRSLRLHGCLSGAPARKTMSIVSSYRALDQWVGSWAGKLRIFSRAPASSLFLLFCCGRAPLPNLPLRGFIYEEGTNAEIARDILTRGDFLQPFVYGIRWHEKPSLLSWLIAGFATLTGGVNEWSARLPTILSVLLTALMAQAVTRRYASLNASLFAALSFVFCPLLLQKLTVAEPDTSSPLCRSPRSFCGGRAWPRAG